MPEKEEEKKTGSPGGENQYGLLQERKDNINKIMKRCYSSRSQRSVSTQKRSNQPPLTERGQTLFKGPLKKKSSLIHPASKVKIHDYNFRPGIKKAGYETSSNLSSNHSSSDNGSLERYPSMEMSKDDGRTLL